MRTTLTPLASLALVLTLALAGCGQESPSKNTAEDATDSSAASPTADAESTPTEPDSTESSAEPSGAEAPRAGGTPGAAAGTAIPVYFAGSSPQRVRLFREFHRAATGDPVSEAVTLAVSGTPSDPNYRTLWPAGVTARVAAYDGDVLNVSLRSGSPLRTRPAGMNRWRARQAIEQVVFTAQGALGKGRVPVQLRLNGKRSDQVLGVPTSEPLANGSPLQVLNHVNITAPAQGETVTGKQLKASGVANSFEANVLWRIRSGTTVVKRGFATADGWMDDKLFPWSTQIDISKLPAGDYTFVALTDDPSGGAEGPGPHRDTKDFTITR